MKKQLKISIETLMHKWPVFGIGFAGGSIRMDGSGIKSVRAILSDYADLLDVLSARTMIRCHRLTEKRLHDMLDGSRKPHDVEITSL